MTTLLWILQGLLALAFLAAGSVKLTKSREAFIEMGMGYAEDLTDGQLKIIGVLEVLGGIGVILPSALNILPVLAGVAATGLVLTMIGATITHLRRGEAPMIGVNLLLGGMAAFVAYSHLL